MYINPVFATIDDLRNYKTELLEIIKCSLEVNHNKQIEKKDCMEVYEKLIRYFKAGQTEVLLVKLENKIVGYAQFFKKNDERVHLNQIAISEKYQNKGIGTILIHSVEKNAKKYGVKYVELFCSEINKKAKFFYDKNKYTPEKYLMIKKI